MTEETIFAAALDKGTPAERAAFLDEACAGDPALRRRVEALLESHERAGFLETPAIRRAAEVFGGGVTAGATEAETTDGADPDLPLDVLAPSDEPRSLGRLGHYEVLEVVGRGGMGVVLRAFDGKLHRVVAIKVMAAQLATDAAARRRFTREARAAAAVSHDHVVTIHAVEEAGGLPYLVMQYVSGTSLQERLDRGGPLGLAEVVRIGMQVAAGLAAAHAQGLVHRDVKPSNILLENGVERVMITDFGLARAAADDASLTQTGVVAGTPPYMSPEQAQGQPLDRRSDLFSLGSVLYAMCTGHAPFRGSGTVAVLRSICEETPAPIRGVNPEIPDWLAAIVQKLQAKEPAQRYQSAAEVAELLGRHLARIQQPAAVSPPITEVGENRAAPPLARIGIRRGRRPRVAAAAVISCLVAGLGLSEATGLTRLAATAIRIVSPDGTLVVQTDGPGAAVTIEGDGGRVIAGAGPQEVRLRPGRYRVHVTESGKPVRLDRDLVTLTRSGRQVVRVRPEPDGVPDGAVAGRTSGAFVLLGGGGLAERAFDSLADAVLAARDGDIVEVRGKGPFVTGPIIVEHALTIRAATGVRPILLPDPEQDRLALVLLRADAPLVLEGLEFRRTARNDGGRWQAIIQSQERLSLVNCRLLAASHRDCLWSKRTLALRNSELLVSDPNHMTPVSWSPEGPGRAIIENCVILGALFSRLKGGAPGPRTGTLQLRHNTFVGQDGLRFEVAPPPPASRPGRAGAAIEVESSRNIFDVRRSMLSFAQAASTDAPAPATDEALLRRFLECQDEQNLYSSEGHVCALYLADRPAGAGKDLHEWNRLWSLSETGTVQGPIRFQGGDLFARARSELGRLIPEDFRVPPDGAGYRAGRDGKDLGADVDLVGPGPAYERWKTTPGYQQWLKETGQVR